MGGQQPAGKIIELKDSFSIASSVDAHRVA